MICCIYIATITSNYLEKYVDDRKTQQKYNFETFIHSQKIYAGMSDVGSSFNRQKVFKMNLVEMNILYNF